MKNNLISEVDRIKNLMLINEASGGVWDSVITGLKSITRNDSVVVKELDDILTNVKAGRINPTELVNKLSVLGMSLDGNTLVRYVELMTTGLDDVSKSQIKQISKGLKNGSIELVDAKNALSQMGQTSSVDDLLEKYADELSISPIKTTTKTSIELIDDVRKAFPRTPIEVFDQIKILSNQIDKLPTDVQKFDFVMDKIDELTNIYSKNKKLYREEFLNTVRHYKETILTILPKIRNPKKFVLTLLGIVAILAAGCAIRSVSSAVGELFSVETNKWSEILRKICLASGNSGSESQPQETKPQETKPKEPKPQKPKYTNDYFN
jgi:hypothetical protein